MTPNELIDAYEQLGLTTPTLNRTNLTRLATIVRMRLDAVVEESLPHITAREQACVAYLVAQRLVALLRNDLGQREEE